jgi:hypothetical protein
MNHTTAFEDRLVYFLHETFPDSLDMPEGELAAAVGRIVGRSRSYGFDSEADIVVYVTTAYLLGEHFDTQFPAAADILNDHGYAAGEKAQRLENWTRLLFETLEGGTEPGAQADAAPADTGAGSAEIPDYLSMQAGVGPYREMAERLVDLLVAGDAAGVIRHFSPNFAEHLGLPVVERVFTEQMLPFFNGATGLGNTSTVTYTHDAFGSQGYAFYLALKGPDGPKPFAMYLVNESGRIVLANVVLDKVYSG